MPPIAAPDIYSGTPGAALYAGLPAPAPPPAPPADALGAVTVFSEDSGVPFAAPDQFFALSLHASGGSGITTGRQYRAAVSGRLEYGGFNQWAFSTLRGTAVDGRQVTICRPTDAFDRYGGTGTGPWREGYWMGFTGMGLPEMRLIVERRLDALMAWVNGNLPVSATRRSVSGGSMGAWGSLTYGLRRPHMFAVVSADRPRWRWAGYDAQTANVPNWASGNTAHTVATSPNLLAEDGGGKVVDHMNMIAYVANPANKMPFLQWNIGRNDGFSDFRDHVDAVAALRSAKRGFAFAWNNGNHSTGSIPGQFASYNGLFEIGKGYPLFTNHSGDANPSVDLEGGINIGLKFRNVVESASAWSCEVTSVLGARTVSVEPLSSIFTAPVVPQVANIPAANTWVPVSFTA